LELLNKSPLQFAPMVGRINFPGHSLTLIIKGTFDLKLGEKAELSEEQLYPTSDEFYPDDDEMKGSPRYEMDFAYHKPRADLLLVGKCYSPGEKALKACQVTFRVGSKSRSLAIFGKRSWKHDVMGLGSISDPRPFRTMELRYEKSYGGEEYKKNPLGRGFSRSLDTVGIKGKYLPNIEDPKNLIETSGSHPQPAGFGPLNRMWELRHSKMGSYKDDYLKKSWPWFPSDFDWSHFNAAPPEMQLEGYLRGDEELFFENLHKKHPNYKSRLPGLRIRSFINKLVNEKSAETDFIEVPLNLDTLWVDMEAEKLILVWRGWTEVSSEDYEEVRQIFIISEDLDKQAQKIEKCHELFLATVEEQREELELVPEFPGESAGQGGVSVDLEDDETRLAIPKLPEDDETQLDISRLDAKTTTKADIETSEELAEEKLALIKKIESQTAALMTHLGFSIENLPAEVKQQAKEQGERIIQKLTETDPNIVMELEQEEQEKKLREELSKLGLDYDSLPEVSEKAKAEQERLMQEMGITQLDSSKNEEYAKFWKMLAAVMPQIGVDPENLSPLIETARPQIERIKDHNSIEAEDEEAMEEAEVLNNSRTGEKEAEKDTQQIKNDSEQTSESSLESIKEKMDKTRSLADMDLSGKDLSGLEMPGVDFAGALMSGVVLTGANLAGANFSGAALIGADLSNANLEKADLQQADFSEGNLSGVNLSGAKLNDTVFEKAKMDHAILDQVEANEAIFTEADLSLASFKNAELSGSDFSNCLLHEADFQGANLTEASVEGAMGTKVNFREANLTRLRASEKCNFSQANFIKAIGPESTWHESILNESDFSFSQMEAADFSKASLEKANLSAANMKFSRFIKANLKETKMLLLNLFEGSLEKADLSGADLSGANLYGVEFLGTVTNNTLLNRANLKMTKLEKK